MPVAAAVVAAAVIGGLVQAYNSEQARGAARSQLKKIEDLYNSLVPPNYNLSIQDPPELHKEALAAPQFAAEVNAPNFDMTAFTPEKLKVVGQYAPQLAPLIKEVAPTLIKQSDDMKTGKAAQLAALDKLTKIGEGGFDPEYAQKVQQAQAQSQSQARAQQASLMDSFQRRGIGGSGLELAAALQGNSSAMNSAAQSNQQAATDAYRNQLSALSSGAQLGGNIYAQDQSTQAQNAGIINAFNQRMSSAQQNWEQQNANTMNEAQVRNLTNSQDVANQNVNNANSASLANRARADDLSKFGYNANLQQQTRADSLAQEQYQNQVNERGYQNQIAQSLADWKNKQIQQQNATKAQTFNDQLAQTGGKSGSAQSLASNTLQTAADRNQAISGLAGAATTGALAYQNQENADADRSSREEIAKKYGYNVG